MRSYRDALLGVNPNDLVLSSTVSESWDLERRLARARPPQAKTGKGSKRRSAYEHQLDRIDDLVHGAAVEGQLVELETGHGMRRRKHTVYVWELLYKPLPRTSGAVEVYRRLIFNALRWLALNHPSRRGWALHQSARRAARDPRATRYYLPRRSWTAFFAWRRAYDYVVRLLLVLRAWAPTLLGSDPFTARRGSYEETRRPGGSESDTGTRYRAQSLRRVRALTRRLWPQRDA